MEGGGGYALAAPVQAELALPASPSEAPRAAQGMGQAVKKQSPVAPTDATANVGVAATSQPSPLLIYQAKLALAVYEVDLSLDAVEALAKQAGGYLVRRMATSIVVRVPAAGFDGTLKTILGMGDVLQRELEVEDVTAKVRDLEARLANAEAVRKRLAELLAGANKTEEALAVERELSRVSEEIEQMKSQLKLLSELVAYSTITVRFEAPQAENLDRRFKLPFPWLDELGLSNLLSL